MPPTRWTKLSRDETVTLAVLEKICAVVDADFGDITGVLPATISGWYEEVYEPDYSHVGNRIRRADP